MLQLPVQRVEVREPRVRRGAGRVAHELRAEPVYLRGERRPSGGRTRAQRHVEGLCEVAQFLDANPTDVVTIIYESYVPGAAVVADLRAVGLDEDAFTQGAGFTISVLAQSQQALARQFATGNMSERFAGVQAQREAGGRLRLEGCVAWFECDLHQLVEAGPGVGWIPAK